MTDLITPDEETLYERVAQIIETARAHVSRPVCPRALARGSATRPSSG